MDAVQQDDDDARFRKADLEHGGAEFKGDDGFLLCIVPDNELLGTSATAYYRIK